MYVEELTQDFVELGMIYFARYADDHRSVEPYRREALRKDGAYSSQDEGRTAEGRMEEAVPINKKAHELERRTLRLNREGFH